MSQFRIQKRIFAPNILEVEVSKGVWKPYLAPLVGKKEGDELVNALLNILKIAKKYS
jgi:hypothetical protein